MINLHICQMIKHKQQESHNSINNDNNNITQQSTEMLVLDAGPFVSGTEMLWLCPLKRLSFDSHLLGSFSPKVDTSHAESIQNRVNLIYPEQG